MDFMRQIQGAAGCFGIFVALIAGCIGGCGPTEPKIELADVTGKVTYNGEPLKMGTVMFQPASGAFASGEIKPDGTYSLKGAIGPNKVMIVSRDPEPGPPGPEPAQRKAAEEALAANPPKKYIPDEYGTQASKLTYEVKAGTNTADFTLP